MYYIYILYSSSSDIYYVGSTNNYQRRLMEHNTKGDTTTFTFKHRPWELKVVFSCGEIESESRKLEMFIKKQKSRVFLEKLIAEDFIPEGKLSQLVRVPML